MGIAFCGLYDSAVNSVDLSYGGLHELRIAKAKFSSEVSLIRWATTVETPDELRTAFTHTVERQGDQYVLEIPWTWASRTRPPIESH